MNICEHVCVKERNKEIKNKEISILRLLDLLYIRHMSHEFAFCLYVQTCTPSILLTAPTDLLLLEGLDSLLEA